MSIKRKFSFCEGEWEFVANIKKKYEMGWNEFICKCKHCGNNVNKEAKYEIISCDVYKQDRNTLVIGTTTTNKTIVVNKEIKELVLKEVQNGN